MFLLKIYGSYGHWEAYEPTYGETFLSDSRLDHDFEAEVYWAKEEAVRSAMKTLNRIGETLVLLKEVRNYGISVSEDEATWVAKLSWESEGSSSGDYLTYFAEVKEVEFGSEFGMKRICFLSDLEMSEIKRELSALEKERPPYPSDDAISKDWETYDAAIRSIRKKEKALRNRLRGKEV